MKRDKRAQSSEVIQCYLLEVSFVCDHFFMSLRLRATLFG